MKERREDTGLLCIGFLIVINILLIVNIALNQSGNI